MSAGKWFDEWKEKNKDKLKDKYKDKSTWLVIGITGLLLLVIALPDGKSDTGQNAGSADTGAAQQTEANGNAYTADSGLRDDPVQAATQDLERRLEETLSLIDGAGQVRVMLTLKDTGEKVVEKDTSRRSGDDGSGASEDVSENTVFGKNGSDETPYVSNELTPQVEGVLVVAQGGGDSIVKQNILQSVMALFPLEAHKITIVKMSMQEVSEHENF